MTTSELDVLTAQQVRDKTFTSTRFKPGYEEDEVDTFLDDVERSLDLLHAEVGSLRTRLAVAAATPGPVTADDPLTSPLAPPAETPGGTEMEEMLRRTLLLAQRTADQAVAEAREQADQALAEARREAQRLVSEATGRAESAEREAEARSTAMISEADAQRRAVEARLEALRSFEREYRARLRAYFELQLRELEGVGAGSSAAAEQAAPPAPPAAAPAAPPPAATPAPAAQAPAPTVPSVAPPAEPPAPAATTVTSAAPPDPGVATQPQTGGFLAPPESSFADLHLEPPPHHD